MAEETFSQTSAWPRRRRRRRSNRAHVDYNEMSVRYGSVKLQLPTGFKSLLEHLTREILREQPANIPEFAAAYFKHLLQKREDGVPDPAYLVNERITETAGAGELQPAVVDEPVVESPTQDEEPAAQPAASEQSDDGNASADVDENTVAEPEAVESPVDEVGDARSQQEQELIEDSSPISQNDTESSPDQADVLEQAQPEDITETEQGQIEVKSSSQSQVETESTPDSKEEEQKEEEQKEEAPAAEAPSEEPAAETTEEQKVEEPASEEPAAEAAESPKTEEPEKESAANAEEPEFESTAQPAADGEKPEEAAPEETKVEPEVSMAEQES